MRNSEYSAFLNFTRHSTAKFADVHNSARLARNCVSGMSAANSTFAKDYATYNLYINYAYTQSL